ncbi:MULTISPECIES: asparaginase [unclassified Arthrobacter]|uniref:asparaginase n=1 Tax=unclassified Arthrobacter TaxID=235627 RepID=UPI001D1508CF|nr:MULTISPECIES: asparaginase [unclassified Arthrobacter]MCC3279672.1 asparaginase [Arthrobacter sp. zg-Y40]MCC9178073.1 asparaginase [Arthrobacter sp. zg-Y750]MCC3274334.1 asparaginase [Arthrobacter sp. zg-Y20]MDK1314490.1 asparaginase [Arthrobacter sp. zg.Y20]WIB07474.1 asparaginase [Arthrobacter sp. zg-Y20]
MVSPAAPGTASARISNAAEQLAELAVVIRSGVTESRHFGWLAALDADGNVAASLGAGSGQVLPRSTTKPLQALACLRAGADLSGPELAIAAGSHTGEDAHVEAVRSILERAGLDDSALACPADWPEDEASRERLIRAGKSRSRVHMNCSGKHAAMLLACTANGWDTAGYLDPAHPLQLMVRDTVERATGVPVEHAAVDGCGAPLFSTTVLGLAQAFRTLVTASPGTPERLVADAMRANPFHVGGTGHANSSAMTLVPGVLAKGGAEGVIGMSASTGQAVAMKIVDGNPRATTLIALKVLEALGVDTSGAGALMDLPINGGSERVGRISIGSDVAAWAENPVPRW